MASHSTRIFVAAVMLVLLQYPFVWKFGEPYPAVRMPGFSGSPVDRAGHFSTKTPRTLVVFDDATSASPGADELFAEALTSHRSIMFALWFPDAPTWPVPPSDAEPSWHRWAPGYGGRIAWDRETIAKAPETRSWLRQRLQTMYGREPRSFTVRWYADDYDTRSGLKLMSRQLLSERRIDF